MTLREYCKKEGITLGSGYRRIWNGLVPAVRVDGRWLIVAADENNSEPSSAHEAEEDRP